MLISALNVDDILCFSCLSGKVDEAKNYYWMVESRGPTVHPAVFCAALKNLGNILWHEGDTVQAEVMLARALLAIESTSALAGEHPDALAISTMLDGLRSNLLPPPMPYIPTNTSAK